MALVVHKYGGSSVADAEKILNVARRIIEVKRAGVDIVAVVSAMGDTTDELIRLAHTVSPEPEPRELDLLLSTGELVSCTLLTMALRSLGYNAISLSGSQAGIRTDTTYGRARIHHIDIERINRELQRDRVVVVAGFQGITEDLDITTLGRGGSDTTAVALAAALGAERCDIYTDVEGIYTADPRVVPQARRLPEIGYVEMLELANYGAKMHPRSIELGAVYRVPIYVASSFSDVPGTLIHQGPDEHQMEDRVKVTGIAYQTSVAK
ncbi:MAG TPA: aspartate kinase, partial [Dehalococcoidia bacterium]|nr:aspartate kinase [Dehalococcoidia bacterium]